MHNKLNTLLKCRINGGFQLNVQFLQRNRIFLENNHKKITKIHPETQHKEVKGFF